MRLQIFCACNVLLRSPEVGDLAQHSGGGLEGT
jgi:hypothetical protein